MIYILNQQEEIIDVLEPNKERKYYHDLHVLDLKENSETLEFTSNVDIAPNTTLVYKTLSGELHPFIVQEVVNVSSYSFTKTYYCDAEYLELRYTKIVDPVELPGQTAETALQYGLQGTRWSVGVIESNKVADVIVDQPMTLLRYIRYLSEIFELEINYHIEFGANFIKARYVDLIPKVGIDAGKEIVFGKDLEGIERRENSSAIVTALYAVGPVDEQGRPMSIESVNGGLPYVQDTAALQRWGKKTPGGLEHRFDIYTPPVDLEHLTPQVLKEMTVRELHKRINTVVTYVVNAVDLYDVLGMEHERVFLGDTVRIKDTYWENAPLYLEARVIRIERSRTDPTRNRYTLGDYREIDIETYDYIRQIQALLNRKRSSWNNAEENAVSRAQLIINQTAASWSATVISLEEDINGQITSINTQLSIMDSEIKGEINSFREEVDGQISTINTQLGIMDGKIESKVEQSTLTAAVADAKDYADTAAGNALTNAKSHTNSQIATVSSSITQLADQISSKVEQTDFNGNKIISLIEQTAESVKISANKIELSGITEVADQLMIGGDFKEGEAKTIFFRGRAGGVVVSSPRLDDLRLAAINSIEINAGTAGVKFVGSLDFTKVDNITWGNNKPVAVFG